MYNYNIIIACSLQQEAYLRGGVKAHNVRNKQNALKCIASSIETEFVS